MLEEGLAWLNSWQKAVMKPKPKVKIFLFSGILAAHKITASAPDTDLPTVAGLRVGFRIYNLVSLTHPWG